MLCRSGSMAGEKLKLTIHALTFCIGQLTADDRLAIVSFDSEASANLQPSRSVGTADAC